APLRGAPLRAGDGAGAAVPLVPGVHGAGRPGQVLLPRRGPHSRDAHRPDAAGAARLGPPAAGGRFLAQRSQPRPLGSGAARKDGTMTAPDTSTAVAPHPIPALAPPPVGQPRRLPLAGHDLTVFAETWPTIKAMVEDIRAAKTRVWLESYIFLNDAAGKAVAEALKDAARNGADVRLLYDAVGSQTTPASFFAQLSRAGVRVHCFHSLWEALWKFSFLRVLNRRDHASLLSSAARF